MPAARATCTSRWSRTAWPGRWRRGMSWTPARRAGGWSPRRAIRRGHISLHAPEHRLLVTGDAVHSDDLGWVDATRPDMLDAAEATVRRLTELGCRPRLVRPRAAHPGPGRNLGDGRAAAATMAAGAGAHGVARRQVGLRLCVDGRERLARGRRSRRCCTPAHGSPPTRRPFSARPAADLVPVLLAEMLRSGAARWQGQRLMPGVPFNPPRPGWVRAATEPARWPT